jgi:hypothetical protein
MTVEFLYIVPVIVVFSVVQSIFGMGLLVFGTPTLLLMGLDFTATLGLLLPASFAISLLQTVSGRVHRTAISNELYFICLPAIGVGFWMEEFSPLSSWTNLMIGGTLMLSAIIRIWPPFRVVLCELLENHSKVYHLVMGLAHGLTNLGGALLAILASGTSSDKAAIRYTVAHYYLAFSSTQMIFMVAYLGYLDQLLIGLPMALISSVVYLLVGNRVFLHTSNSSYDVALTVFIAIYGVFVLVGT